MSKDESSLRQPPGKTDAELIAVMGTDPTAWAAEFGKVLGPFGIYNPILAKAWFYHAIEAGRNAANEPEREDRRNRKSCHRVT